MRQLILANDSVKVARMPVPGVEPGCVLIRVQFSMISTGTEVAGLRKFETGSASTLEQVREMTSTAGRYLRKAVTNPRAAVARLKRIGHDYVSRHVPPPAVERKPDIPQQSVQWYKDNAEEFAVDGEAIRIRSDMSDWQYQAHTEPFEIPAGYQVAIDLHGNIASGKLGIGLLDDAGTKWLANKIVLPGDVTDRLILDPQDASAAKLVLSNAKGGITQAAFSKISIVLIAPNADGNPHSEMDEIGWNIGYSAAGEVIAVGSGITDLRPGDHVACGGAGKANHADYVLVPRNLVARVPEGCDVKWAATTTVGTIALQGVRRAQPVLGERICVIGLGLLGQLTVQLLRASGCQVFGLDLDPRRVERARSLGMEAGSSDPSDFLRIVRDLTSGQGADRTLITAATKSSSVINSAMEMTRRRGTVVIIGDIGMEIERAHFYRKEIDLLMSTSYGPGRYDAGYEEKGIDYPFAYVRWTLNRNMQSYMELIAAGRLNVEALVDVIAPVDKAPELYETLANSKEAPLGVLLEYPYAHGHGEPVPETEVRLKGARTAQSGKISYILVGAGAYGQSMLVPMMDKLQDRFFLRGVVSRDAVRGGNFVRDRRLEVFASELEPVLQDDKVQMLVIATRHCDHARQVLAGLKAGKHIFVEKPLAITWEELDKVVNFYESMSDQPILMVGFNRRFSPAIRAVKQALVGRTSPLVISYRLNGGYIPLDHWIQTEQGGGRNIGEACHMYDLFRSLSNSPVVSVNATAINPAGKPYLPSDNFAATIAYEDGSIGNLVYTALGPKKGLPKEHIEVFCDGDAFIIDDFKQVTKAGTGEILWSAPETDKGQAAQMTALAHSFASGQPAPIPFEEIAETTAVSLYIEDLLFGRVLANE